MSTDKTLADVQPGGRVRLGGALLPCPLCGNDAEFVPYKNNGLTLKCKSMGCIQRHQRTLRYGIEWLRTSMTEHWNTRALSAQPSPGGQGDARALIQRYDAAGAKFRESLMDDHYSDAQRVELRRELTAAQDELLNALAARQPVGEPVARLIEAVEGECDGLVVSADTAASILAHVFPLGQTPTAYMVNGRIEQGLFFDRAAADAMATMNAGDVVPLYAAPPAQAVDLGQFRQAVHDQYELAKQERDAERISEDSLIWHAARRDRLLAMIGGQAVGK